MQQAESKVRSPCMGVCALDDNDLCIACRRSGSEITQWGRYTQAQRRQVLCNIEQRFKDEESGA